MKLQINPQSKPDRAMLDEYLDEMKGVHWVECKKVKKGKSRDNENYYRKCIIRPLSESIGYTRNEEDYLHDWLLDQFSFEIVDGPDGEPYKRVIRSTDKKFDSAWQSKYYEQIRIWALSELSFKIKLPNEDLNAPIDKNFKG